MAHRDKPFGLFHLPREILEVVISFLSKHDLTVCVRVNKAWYEQFIDRIWHTVKILGSLSFHCFMGAYGGGPANSAVSLARNDHRIRVLSVYHISALDAFSLPATLEEGEDEVDSGQAGIMNKENELLLIEELSVYFFGDPYPPLPPGQVENDVFGRIIPRSLFAPPLPAVTAPPSAIGEELSPVAPAPTLPGGTPSTSLFGGGATSTPVFGVAPSSTAPGFGFGAPVPPPSGETSSPSLFTIVTAPRFFWSFSPATFRR